MKKSVLFLIMSGFCCWVYPQDTIPIRFAKTITEQELREHVYKLASAEFKGRYTGSRGQVEAGEYIVGEFREDGLEAPEISGKKTYHQQYILDNCRWKDQKLVVNGMELKVGQDFLFLSDPVNIKGTFSVVFAGFGIDDDHYSDFKDLDVKGKILLVFSGEPRDKEGNSVITGESEQSKKGYYFSKAAQATVAGAAGVIIIAQKDSEFKDFLKNRETYEAGPNITLPGNKEGEIRQKEVFSAFVDLKTAAKLVGEKPAGLSSALDEMNLKLKTAAGRFNGTVTIDASSDCLPLLTSNIIGVVEGTVKKQEAVVVVAHYDHLGEKGGEIYVGADDNASGTAAVMELAEAFALAAKEGSRPRRTIIFLAVSGEEEGLFGSQYYTEHPIISLDSTYACINIDMIGRAPEKRAGQPEYIAGYAYQSEELYNISKKCNRLAAPGLEDDMEYKLIVRGGSDHYYFAKHGIPSLFYFEGFHDDYHRPTDTPDKVLYSRMEQIVRAIFAVTWELANREERLSVQN